ncbi:MAG: 4-hydroxy-2-oxoheptanedioate aldolase [Steroidobacteraceae bacterium]
MELPVNAFKQALRAGRPQIGLWVGLADAHVAELLATTGFDWLLFDAEHAPNDLRSLLAQLRAAAPYPVSPIVRPVIGDAALIKQLLDAGAQTLLIPMVETAEQARALVAAIRYPPRGIRGVGSALARAARWGQVEGYLARAEEELCLLLQVESVRGMENLEAIAAVEGVDGVFFGPSDLAASMGLLGKSSDPAVLAAVRNGIAAVRRSGKAAGVLTTEIPVAHAYLEQGAAFVGVGVDTLLLGRAARELAAQFKSK